MANLAGACLCGAVAYEITGDPLAVVICHCDSCRRQSGSAYSVNIVVPRGAYRQVGDTRTFASIGGSGDEVRRDFCGGCGSPIITRADHMPEVVAIKGGTIRSGTVPAPMGEIFCLDAFGWLPDIPGTTRVPDGSLGF